MFVTLNLLHSLMHLLPIRECVMLRMWLPFMQILCKSNFFIRYIMVIVSNTAQNGSQEWGKGVQKAATLLNIQKARGHFEQFIPRS